MEESPPHTMGNFSPCHSSCMRHIVSSAEWSLKRDLMRSFRLLPKDRRLAEVVMGIMGEVSVFPFAIPLQPDLKSHQCHTVP
ncbi:hypothetical protein DL98DRAFT_509095 [Cadophora sp. DSE1049]|nr:hypothetical protein DL98DRAFT_509095 [Cadophora sp. DSE1049]